MAGGIKNPKIKVNVLTTYDSPNSLGFIYPIMVNRTLFSERGVEFRFYDSINSRLLACDALFVNSKFFRAWHSERHEELYNTLGGFKKKIHTMIWFDMADSSGTTQFNVMPYVDGYYKSQLLRDKSLYETNFYGNRIFTDYYRKHFGIDDVVHSEGERAAAAQMPLRKEDAHKLHLSWNSAMNDWGSHIYNYTVTGMAAKLRANMPLSVKYTARFFEPSKTRKIEVAARIGLSHARNTVRRQREEIVKVLNNKFGLDTAVIPRKQYIKELISSKIAVSPFGLGEISCRDFEIMINGALLYKQDMSHLETWPPLYVNDETYIPFLWDLSDFEDNLRKILKDEDEIRRVSENAQKTYGYYLYGDGRFEFCDKVMSLL